jgi:2-oxopent-4-enoate/cis-2-oxohex-4-enoate hydratase
MKIEQSIRLGDELFEAFRNCATIQPLTARQPGLTIVEAYAIQDHFVRRRLAAGERLVGRKIGATSLAVQRQLGVSQPDFGQLTSGMDVSESAEVPLGSLIQPRAEAEVALVLKRDLIGPGITATDVLRATEYVVPCFEIVDSRIADWKIAIQDTIADNASCGVFVLGDAKARPTSIDLTLAGMVLERNGELVSTAAGAAVQGGPMNSVAWLANTLGDLGIGLLAGDIILSGSQSELVKCSPGDSMRCHVGGLGTCDIRFTREAA